MTAPAVGIHDHDTRKLGKRPPKRKAAVNAGDFLLLGAGQLPTHPIADPVPPLNYPMDRNDEAGDCVVAGLDHALQTIHAALGVHRDNWTDAQLLAHYQTQNPGFTSWAAGGSDVDGGMDIQTFLEHLVRTGDIVAFGKIDHRNEDLMKAAVWVGLAIVTGEDLQAAQQDQLDQGKPWDYKPSADWGGHCTTTVSYNGTPDTQGVVTWGEVVQVTQAFIDRQLEEAWFILTKAQIQHPSFRNAFDLPGFAAAVSALTGGKVVVPVPAPTPVPVPAPVVPTPEVDFPYAQLDAFAAHPYSIPKSKAAASAYKVWRQTHQG